VTIQPSPDSILKSTSVQNIPVKEENSFVKNPKKWKNSKGK